jgi:glycosyltransferase involved in cell wall biosynthesis
MNKYNIAIIAKDILNKEETGIENYTINILKEFDKYTNFSFTVYINHKYEGYKYKNIKFKYIKNKPFWMHLYLPLQLRKDKPDLIFSPIPSTPLITQVKSIVVVHDLSFKYMKQKRMKTTRFFIKHSIDTATKIIAVSNFTKNQILNNFKIKEDKIKIIYESCDRGLYTFEKKKRVSGVLKVLCVGTINKRKNFTHIVKTIPILKKKFDTVKLTIIGKFDDDYVNLQKTIKDLGVENDVIITGYVSNIDLVDYFHKNDVFVYASKEEGFGIPILEAYSSGTPVVTSNVSATKEIGESASVLVDPNNFFDIADGIIAAYENSNELTKLGLIEVKKYTWEKTSKEIINLIYETITLS